MNVSEVQASTVTAWENFINKGDIGSSYVRPEIKHSWARCKNFGVAPLGNGSNVILSDKELKILKLKKSDLRKVARPFMENLFKFIAGTGFVVILSDEKGFILEMFGDPDLVEFTSKVNLVPGSNWSEKYGGTNGIGTTLILKKPIQISGAEHYIRKVHSLTCSAAPIYDQDSNIIGVLQMSGLSHATHLHTLGMVIAAVKAIEDQMLAQLRNRELTLANSRLSNIFTYMSDGVLIFNSEGSCTNVNSAAEKILNKDAKGLLDKHVESIFPEQYSEKIDGSLKLGKRFSDMEIFFESGNSSYDSCLVSGDLIKDENENTNGAVLIIKPLKKVNNLVNRLSGAHANFSFNDIIGKSPHIREAIRIATLAAESNSTVLLQGESGTGKEIFAQAIHNRSLRKNGPFVALNCGAIPSELIDSELFGYVEGAFTGAKKGGRPGKFELASGGTLFLDEIGDMNFSKQVSLLRAIQERKIMRVGGDKLIPIDVRIIAATNKNLKDQVLKGTFRQDLYYRLNVISVFLPPLRDRLEDIPILFNYFLQQECKRMGKKIDAVDDAAILALQEYNWPGNIRELQNVAERMVCIVDNNHLRLEDLPNEILAGNQNQETVLASFQAADIKLSIKQQRQERKKIEQEYEREEIIKMLIQFGGNISRVADEMNFSRTTMYRKIKTYGIETYL